jgi:hypothetical protein
VSKRNCSSQKPLLTTGIRTQDFWFRSVFKKKITVSLHEGEAEESQIFLWDTHILPKWLESMASTADVTSGNPIAVWSQSISSVSAVNPLVAFTTSMEESESH